MRQYHSLSGPSNKISPLNIDLETLFSVKSILNARGFSIKTEGDVTTELLLPIKSNQDRDLLFNAFNEADARQQILKFVNNSTMSIKDSYAKRLIEHHNFLGERQRYSVTFEWYLGEIMIRFFSAYSSTFGVEVQNIYRNSDGGTSGDFDALVVMRNLSLIYFECKTGNFRSREIQNAIERAISLHCEFGVIVYDKKISEIKLIDCLKNLKHPLSNDTKLKSLEIKNLPESQVYEWNNCYFLHSNANFENALRTILRINEAKKVYLNYVAGMSEEDFKNIGYKFTLL